jgi:hypothetical protein
MPETYRIRGTKGLLEVTGSTITFTPQSGKDGRRLRSQRTLACHMANDSHFKREAIALGDYGSVTRTATG